MTLPSAKGVILASSPIASAVSDVILNLSAGPPNTVLFNFSYCPLFQLQL